MAKLPRRQNKQMNVTLAIVGVFMLFLLFHMLARQPDEAARIEFSEMLTAINLPEDNPERIVAVNFKENEITGNVKMVVVLSPLDQAMPIYVKS